MACACVAEGVEEDACFSCVVGFVFLFCTTVVFIMLDLLVDSFSVPSAHPLSEQSELSVSENETVASCQAGRKVSSWQLDAKGTGRSCTTCLSDSTDAGGSPTVMTLELF